MKGLGSLNSASNSTNHDHACFLSLMRTTWCCRKASVYNFVFPDFCIFCSLKWWKKYRMFWCLLPCGSSKKVVRCLLDANESVYCRKVADLKLFIGLANNQNLPNGVIQAGRNPFWLFLTRGSMTFLVQICLLQILAIIQERLISR